MDTEEKIPQVILLGNGINRAFGGRSWGELLHDIAAEDKKGINVESLRSPAPFQVIYLTNDTVDVTLKRHKYQLFGKVVEEEHADILRQILSMDADHILTTNYSYELEYTAYPDLQMLSDKKKENAIKKLRCCEKEKTQKDKYMLYEYNELQCGSKTNKIWHIHGEARKHSSIILGHFYYGMLLREITDYIKHKGNSYAMAQKSGGEIKIRSWVDAFILGDVYILGTGLELSEVDLWWLINRKKREKNASHGKVYFYEPTFETGEAVDERVGLIELFTEIVDNMGVTIPKKDEKDPASEDQRAEKFREFYRKAVMDVAQRIAAKKAVSS